MVAAVHAALKYTLFVSPARSGVRLIHTYLK